MDAYKDVFLAESADYIQQITDALLALEREPNDRAPVEAVFRGAHSLKGMSAAMGYLRTADVTHAMEGLMSRVRAGEARVDQDLISLMLSAVDLVRALIDDESAGTVTVEPDETISRLGILTTRERAGAGAADEQDPTVESARATGERILSVVVTLDAASVLKGVRAFMALQRLNQLGRVLQTAPSEADLEDERFDLNFSVVMATPVSDDTLRDALLGIPEISHVDIAETSLASGGSADAEAAGASVTERRSAPRHADAHTVRVDIGRLDTLVDLVGEVIILRSQFDRLVQGREEDLALAEVVGDLHRITAELQYEVLRTRMVPVGNVFRRFPRMVRDLALQLDKRVDFEMTGLDIELDRTLLDEIGDSIVHLIRNAIDHGIEPVEVRLAAGKPPSGSLRLSAARERDHVAIAVADDGHGVDLALVWREACERGLAHAQDRSKYSDSDVLMLLCIPGFSTTRSANQVSGRGVGLDAVKEHVEGLGGTLQISNRHGEGIEFLLRLPLTLAIVKALMVESRGQGFALPLSAVTEVFATKDLRVETVDGVPVIVGDDGVVIPLVRLDALLFGADASTLPDKDSHIVLVTAAGERSALAVDRLLGRQEIVVKPLGPMFSQTQGFSGATVLIDGRVMLILDARSLLPRTGTSQ